MNAISSQWFTDSGTVTEGYDIFFSDSNSKMRLKGKKFRERISDQKERERKIIGRKNRFSQP